MDKRLAIGKRIKELREKFNLTQEELSKKLAIPVLLFHRLNLGIERSLHLNWKSYHKYLKFLWKN